MNDPLRVGVIGVGSMGRNHARVYELMREAELVGITDLDVAARQEVAARHATRAFPDNGSLLREVDAVSIAVPTALHRSAALESLAAGAHVLVEKPIAGTISDAEAIVAGARERRRTLMVGHVERFNPAVRELDRILANERVLAIDARRLSPPTPRVTDVDVVLDLMIHDIDVVLALVGEPLDDLSAVGRPAPPAALDHVSAQGRTARGIIVRLVASKITQETVRELTVTTEDAYITINYLNRDITVSRRAAIRATSPADGYAYVHEAVLARPHVPTVEPLRLELEHFVACVRSGRSPITSGEGALAALRVAERIQRLAH